MKQHLLLKQFILPSFVFCALLVIVLIQYWGYEKPSLGIDDANIYFVYMRNFANGFGFVWNVGDERVEGFTSLLWTLIGAGIYRIAPAHFPFILLSTLFLLTYCTIIVSLNFLRRLNKATSSVTYAEVLFLSLLLLPLGFVDWNILSLMETGLWTCLITCMVVMLCNIYVKEKNLNYPAFLILIVLINLTRPESILFNLLFIAFLFIINKSRKGWKTSMIQCIMPLSVHLASVSAIIYWRFSYFGYAFPNTYYAKVSMSIQENASAGISYAFVFFYNYPINVFIVLMLLFFTLQIIGRYRSGNGLAAEEKIHLILFVYILVALSMPLLTGGDHFKYSRFYQMLLPLLFVAVFNKYCWNKYVKVAISSGRPVKSFLLAAFVGMVLFSAKYTIFDFIASHRRILHYPVIQDFIVSRSGREIAEKMNLTFDSLGRYPSVGTLATGGFALYYKGKTIDLMGLNNTLMAHASTVKKGYRNHASFDKDVFYKLLPDMMGSFYGADVVADTSGFVLPENTPAFRNDYANMVYSGFKQIYDDEKFRKNYIPVLLHHQGTDFSIFDYCSADFLSYLSTTNISVTILERNSLSDKFVQPLKTGAFSSSK